jgi:hypothetical protein
MLCDGNANLPAIVSEISNHFILSHDGWELGGVDSGCGQWVWSVGVDSGCGQRVWSVGVVSGCDQWVWSVGEVKVSWPADEMNYKWVINHALPQKRQVSHLVRRQCNIQPLRHHRSIRCSQLTNSCVEIWNIAIFRTPCIVAVSMVNVNIKCTCTMRGLLHVVSSVVRLTPYLNRCLLCRFMCTIYDYHLWFDYGTCTDNSMKYPVQQH